MDLTFSPPKPAGRRIVHAKRSSDKENMVPENSVPSPHMGINFHALQAGAANMALVSLAPYLSILDNSTARVYVCI